MEPAAFAVTCASLVALAALALGGLHRLSLLVVLWRSPPPPPPPPPPAEWPRVTVQVPLFDEAAVAARAVDAAAALDYPRDRLEVQVLDDSTDETTAIVAARVAHHRAAGLAIEHVRREGRAGYKAGALAHGLARAEGELVAVFDADFVPAPDFLRRTAPRFADPALGLVQARWEHLNRRANLLTRVQALALDAHFRVEQAARCRGGRFFNFNGTAGVFRRAAIEAAGGWQSDTLTEDLDLSLRAQLAGWRFLYLDDVAVPGELPEGVGALRTQQARWTRGAGQTARKLLGAVWRAPGVALAARVEATCQLLLNASYAVALALALLMVPLVALGRPGGDALVAAHTALLALAALPVAAFHVVAQRGARARLEALALVPLLFAVGLGLSLSNALAYAAGLARRAEVPFVRTPKRGDAPARRYLAAPAARRASLELLLAAYAVVGVAAALHTGRLAALPFLVLAACGFLVAGAGSLAERRARPAA
ncbi:MAG: glycosyltransferase [Planctomycetes bacterium]|nr:glycosyltransferase [Planctomycetota bacterium]